MPENEAPPGVAQQVVSSLLENFDCQPVLFVGSGMARRYIGAPDWKGALRMVLAELPDDAPSYDYLAQKHDNDLIAISGLS